MHPVQYVLFGTLFAGLLPMVVTIVRGRTPSKRVMTIAWIGAFVGGVGNTLFVGFTGQPWVLLPAVALTAMLLAAWRLNQIRPVPAEADDPEAVAAVRQRYERDFRVFMICLGAVVVTGLFAVVMGVVAQ